MMRVIKQTLHGCGWLPHVGAHPGTPYIVMILSLGAIAYGLLGIAIMAAVFVPIYLFGAYERAKLSERITLTEVRRAWASLPEETRELARRASLMRGRVPEDFARKLADDTAHADD